VFKKLVSNLEVLVVSNRTDRKKFEKLKDKKEILGKNLIQKK